MNPTQFPTDGTLPLLVLQIIAVSGEFPAAFSGHFPGGCSYIESVIGKLKKGRAAPFVYQERFAWTQADRKRQTAAASKNIHLTLRPILQARPKQTL